MVYEEELEALYEELEVATERNELLADLVDSLQILVDENDKKDRGFKGRQKQYST